MNYKYFILAVLILLSLFFLIIGNSLFENLFAEIVGVILTVYLVDYFLGKDRYLKFKKLNENLNDSLLVFLRINITRCLTKLEVFKKDEITIENIETLDGKLNENINNGSIVTKIEENKNKNQNIFLVNILKSNYEILEKTSKEVEKFKPYPKYEIQNKIRNTIIATKSQIKVLEVIEELQVKINSDEAFDLLNVVLLDNNTINESKDMINNNFKVFHWVLGKIKKDELFQEI